jgi:prepilin peptidase CpaA
MPQPSALALTVLVLVAAAYDLKFRRIPNWLTLAGVAAGIGMNTYLRSLAGLKTALLGLALAAAVYLVFYLLRAMGGGDLKLMAAVGAFAGPSAWLVIFVVTALLGGAAALVLIAVHGRFRKTSANVLTVFRQLLRLEAPYKAAPELDVREKQAMSLPHGAVIAAGTILTLWVGRTC